MSLLESMMVRVKADPLDPSNNQPMMKSLNNVAIHLDWALTHNLNWGLILTEHDAVYTGPLMKFKYEGAMLPIICHPDQRFAVPSNKNRGGFRWAGASELAEPTAMVYFVKGAVELEDPILPVPITEFEVIQAEGVILYTLTVANENSFIVHDLICNKSPIGIEVAEEKVF